MEKGGQATGRPYAAETAPAARLALPGSVREVAAGEAAPSLPGGPVEVVGQRLGPSAGGLAKRPRGPAEVLVPVVVLVVEPMRAVVIPSVLAKGPATP